VKNKSPKDDKKSTKGTIDVADQEMGIGKPIVVRRDIPKHKVEVEEKKMVIASERPVEVPMKAEVPKEVEVPKEAEVTKEVEVPKEAEVPKEVEVLKEVEVPKEAENTKHIGKLKPIVNPPKISNAKRVSKEQIKVFEEDDESDFERHFTQSRTKIRDPMESSDVSAPPTPVVVSAKVPICTDGSVQLSEQAVKDANKYVKNLYQSSSVNNAYKARDNEPYNYGNSKVFAEGIPT
jgi:hypothetical protein